MAKFSRKKFGAAVKAQRVLLNLNQGQLAAKLKMTRTSVVNLESGRQGCTLESLDKLCKALRTTADVLMGQR